MKLRNCAFTNKHQVLRFTNLSPGWSVNLNASIRLCTDIENVKKKIQEINKLSLVIVKALITCLKVIMFTKRKFDTSIVRQTFLFFNFNDIKNLF